ncbi:MAG TPA: YggT family protein, partial [Fervidobacterium sp.]|nr:YggT family protein [Fervidobacterium sp.]
FYHFLRSLSDLIERPLRRFIPNIGYVDITPIIAILILVFIDQFLAQTLIDLGLRLR